VIANINLMLFGVVKGGLIGLFVAVAGWSYAEEYRDFSSADGQTVRARILTYVELKEAVVLERTDRKSFTIPIRALSEADRDYILQWNKNQTFLSDRFFKISAKRNRNDVDEHTHAFVVYNAEQKVYEHGFDVEFVNSSKVALNNLEVEYCIYYEQDFISGGKQLTLQGVKYGSAKLDDIDPQRKSRFITETVFTHKQTLDADWNYTSGIQNVQDGEVHGIRMRVHMTTETGEKVTREYCLPSMMSQQDWKTSSVNVGINQLKRKK
jgi:hypothetical protein